MKTFEEIMEKFLAVNKLDEDELGVLIEDKTKVVKIWAKQHYDWINGFTVIEYKGIFYKIIWKKNERTISKYFDIYQPVRAINTKPEGVDPFYQEVS